MDTTFSKPGHMQEISWNLIANVNRWHTHVQVLLEPSHLSPFGLVVDMHGHLLCWTVSHFA